MKDTATNKPIYKPALRKRGTKTKLTMIKYYVKGRKNPLSGEVKHYATISPVVPVKLASVIEQIEKQCTVNSADVKAVLDALETVIVSNLKNGYSCLLGDLGSFRPTIGSAGQSDQNSVSSSDIKVVRVRFYPSASLTKKMARQNCEFGLAG